MALDPLTTSKQFFQNLFLAFTTSVVAKTFAAPFEGLHKLLYAPRAIHLKNSFSLMRFINEEGFLAFWRGNVGKIVRFFPQPTLGFAFNEIFQKVFSNGNRNLNTDFSRSLFGNLAAGGAAGGISTLMVYPIDLARARFALELGRNPTERRLNGISDCLTLKDGLKKIYAQDGVRGLYQGFSASLLAGMVYRAVYFGGYETAKKVMFPEGNFIEKYLVAQGVTSLAGLVSYPLEVVRVRAMMNLLGLKGKDQFIGIVDCVKKVVAEEGWKGFVKGARLNLLNGVAPALNLVLFDKLQGYLVRKNNLVEI